MSNVFEGTRFCIHTFGCQMNKHDSERVAGMLEGLGALPVDAIEDADLVVFMTCCVREAADTRLYGQVASLKNTPLRAGTPLSKRVVAVGGCIGQRDGDKLLKVAADECGIVFAGGQDHYKGRMVRFGHMGWVDWADALAGLHALAHGLRASGGFSASRDYLETALSAYHRALDVEPGRVIPDVRS